MEILSLFLRIIIKILFFEIVSALNVDLPRPPNIAVIDRISETSGEPLSIRLEMMSDSYLANENLPIWIGHLNTLESGSHVMDDIGPFFMYRDMDTSSAAVYFSKRKQFDGTVSNREILHHVDFNPGTRKASPESAIYRSKIYHSEQIRMEISNQVQEITRIAPPRGQTTGVDSSKYVKSRLTHLDTAYIEIFVVVDGDAAIKFDNDYASIVSYVLVTFNSVDMLYGNATSPKIKINIAGILIGDNRTAFPELIFQNCYESSSSSKKQRLDVSCATNAIRDTLESYQDTIKLDSFDVVVFLTDLELKLYTKTKEKKITSQLLNGCTSIPQSGSNGYKSSHKDIKIALVYISYDVCQSFPVIAHELAHAFNAKHDYGDCRDLNGECTGNLMRSHGSFCRKCLHFSDETLEQLRGFFGSRDGCMFYNEPKSLFHPLSEPRSFWTEDKQCQCYGYDVSYNSLRNSMFRDYFKKILKPEINCNRRLECVKYVNGERVTEETAYYMDGTPCRQNDKVCWNRKCEKIVN